ncbi:MAG: ATP-dependent DNA helicase RecG [Thermincolia bacterium]
MKQENILAQLKKVTLAELRLGCTDAAVFGGFHRFVVDKLALLAKENNCQPYREELSVLRLEFLEYTRRPRAQRKELLERWSQLLDKLMTVPRVGEEVVTGAEDKAKGEKPGPTWSSPIKGGNKIDQAREEKKSTTHGEAKKTLPPKSRKTKDKGVKDTNSPLQYLKSVGPKRVKLLQKLGLNTVEDLLYHFPRRYEDRSQLKKVNQLNHGEVETIQGQVVGSQELRPRRGLTITKVAVHDGTGVFYAVWFNQPYLKKQLKQGQQLLITGKVERRFGAVQITVSDYELMDEADTTHTGRIVPMYPTTSSLNGRTLRNIIKNALDQYAGSMAEFLPDKLLQKYRLSPIDEALVNIHFPREMGDVEKARYRFVFEEFFLLQLGLARMKNGQGEETAGIVHRPDGELYRQFLANLPFKLTQAQEKVLADIRKDMESPRSMNRLIQGDVGSGKTMVAALALLKTVASGYQGALMAPTEILAEQHYLGLQPIFAVLGFRVELLTGSLTRKEKELLLAEVEDGLVHIVIGTHALIQEGVNFKALGLAVTDEQHRFGVRQRAQLQQKGYNPDVLVMTATPIPRTLAMTLYGDLDLSVIDQLPPGRKPIQTQWVKSRAKAKVYKLMEEKIKEGRQVYIICPLVEESEKVDLASATELAQELQHSVFSKYRVGLLHGRMKNNEKDEVMTAFRDGEVQILVSTTVVEVGVNVPNATVMVIKDAERFGLAQLHQLRGRVGRGEHQSYCVLMAEPGTEEGRARMGIMVSTTDGFVIAEEDLELRGPGEFFGTRQSGLPDLKIANILRDVEVLEAAREEAFGLIGEDPGLDGYGLLKEKLREKFRNNLAYIN